MNRETFKKWLYVIIVVLLAILLIDKYISDQSTQAPVSSSGEEKLITYPKKLLLPPPPKNLLGKKDQSAISPDELPELWINANQDDAIKLPSPVIEKKAITINKALLLSLREGDEIQFTLPDGRVMSAVVSKLVVNPGGDKTLQAQIKTEFGDYPFSYTVGINSGFGFIGLPEGRFTIETAGLDSVIYKNPEQPRPLDPNRKDYVMPVPKP